MGCSPTKEAGGRAEGGAGAPPAQGGPPTRQAQSPDQREAADARVAMLEAELEKMQSLRSPASIETINSRKQQLQQASKKQLLHQATTDEQPLLDQQQQGSTQPPPAGFSWFSNVYFWVMSVTLATCVTTGAEALAIPVAACDTL